ncbi:MAG: D-arabinono-1,4-lactone oxidase [Chrysothrix sp. TS-e1954]|nr:MAG: D-arabinono-1,4-lactone oxidase [Chrysothrix sp. TS-e1954]
MPLEPKHALQDLPPPSTSIDVFPNHDVNPNHSTWARTFHSRPSHYFTPSSTDEVQSMVALARRHRKRVVAVGSAHSPSDLTCTNAYMVDLRRMDRVIAPITKDSKSMLVEAGISLRKLNEEAAASGHTLPNLGSINVQSLAGALATGTHGSSMEHGLLSQNVRGLRIVLADGSAAYCSPFHKSDLFRAALVSLGGLGIITEIEYTMVPDRNLSWTQELVTFEDFLSSWEKKTLWNQAEFVRAWWLPYSEKINLWHASATSQPVATPSARWYDALLRESYQVLLWIATYIPTINPWVERTMWGLQTRFSAGLIAQGVAPQREALTLDCLYSQFVNEWALPLSRGPEALRRLDCWIHGDREASGIPFDPRGVWVHSPIEVRVTDGSAATTDTRAFLDPSQESEPTLYLNAILYRPYGVDPPYWRRYYEAFEWLMKDLGGRPHWGKCFQTVDAEGFQGMYAENLGKWLDARRSVDPDGMFVGAWHRRMLLGVQDKNLLLEEVEVERVDRKSGGALWRGAQAEDANEKAPGSGKIRAAASEESFDSFGASTESSAEEVSKEEVVGMGADES